MGREISHPPFEVETPRPKRKRKPSIATLIRQARKAGERGPISVALPDGTTITSVSDGTVEQMSDAAAERLWRERITKNAAH
jgi:hypothetical protein